MVPRRPGPFLPPRHLLLPRTRGILLAVSLESSEKLKRRFKNKCKWGLFTKTTLSPPTSEGWREVMFSVCPSGRWGVVPQTRSGVPSLPLARTGVPSLPQPGQGTLHPPTKTGGPSLPKPRQGYPNPLPPGPGQGSPSSPLQPQDRVRMVGRRGWYDSCVHALVTNILSHPFLR